MESRKISLVLRTGGSAGEGDLVYGQSGRCRIEFRHHGISLSAEGPDYFEAFCAVRLELEAVGLLVSCYGGSRNVFPSRMARDMGEGLVAYRLRPGKPAETGDLVNIFDTGPDVEPATVEEQLAFFRAWA